MADQAFATPAIEQVSVKNKRLSFRVTLNGNTTAASITGASQAQNGIAVWLAAASLTAPTDANFTGLTSTAAPSVIGFYLTDTQAVRVHEIDVPANMINSASMTAGVVTKRGAASAITGNTGVTTTGNVAFQVSCTTLDLDAQTANHEFSVNVSYDVI